MKHSPTMSAIHYRFMFALVKLLLIALLIMLAPRTAAIAAPVDSSTPAREAFRAVMPHRGGIKPGTVELQHASSATMQSDHVDARKSPRKVSRSVSASQRASMAPNS